MKKLTTLFFVLFSLFFGTAANATEIILSPTTSTSSSNTPSTAIYTGAVFTRNLTIGSSGQDVMALKKILGLELGTTTESGYTYTARTANDVSSFQMKYATEILIPSGLSAGTGFAGVSTRAKLNSLTSYYKVKLSDFTVPVIVATATNTTSSTATGTFTKTLRLGSVDSQVIILKSILNLATDTALSPKSFDNIFDAATLVAVNKFQTKYASEILTPSGLTGPTGIVGAATRKKLNAIISSLLSGLVATNASSTTKTSTGTVSKVGATISSSITDAYGTYMSGDDYCNGDVMMGYFADGAGGTYTAVVSSNSDECSAQHIKQIYSFAFPSAITTVSGNNTKNTALITETTITGGLITITVPPETNNLPVNYLSSISPTISFYGATITPTSGTTQDFTKTVNYTVAAIDGTTRTYKVNAKPYSCPAYDTWTVIGKIYSIKQCTDANTFFSENQGLGYCISLQKPPQNYSDTCTNSEVCKYYCNMPFLDGQPEGYLIGRDSDSENLKAGDDIILTVYPNYAQKNICANPLNEVYGGGCGNHWFWKAVLHSETINHP
jgi:hypothetical protein